MAFYHVSVLRTECIEWLNCRPGGIYVDCTLGGAGHSHGILQNIQPGGQLIGIDQDTQALEAAKERLKIYGESVRLVHGNFKDLKSILAELSVVKVNGILYDLGVSSHQLDTAERGFSYQHDAPLDMRMNQQNQQNAADLVNNLPEDELERIIFEYGEERWAKRIVKFIVERRNEKRIDTTGELVDIIKAAIPADARREGPHPAKRTFQALRIALNGELEILQKSIEDGIASLAPGGRLAVISFHSLEDRIVKNTFRSFTGKCTCPPGIPVCICKNVKTVKVLTSKPIVASEEELEMNPRARSAKLRVVEKI